MTIFALAETVANAVLYEGYVLYPYRASAAKNRHRWQFGIVAPRRYSEAGGTEPWSMQTECLIEAGQDTMLTIRVRYLQAQARTVEEVVVADRDVFRPVPNLLVDGEQVVTWDEGIEQQVDIPDLSLARLLLGHEEIVAIVPWVGLESELVRSAEREVVGRVTRERFPIFGVAHVSATQLKQLVRVRIRLENLSPWPMGNGGDRDEAMRRSLLGAHTMLAVRGGSFVSLLEPPDSAKEAVDSCVNEHTWPVMIGAAGEREVMLSSPIILYDYPATAPESAGDLCDATEIDEILMLRVMTMTDEEKREARGTDERARQIVERSDSIPAELFERLHGAIRSLEPAAQPESQAESQATPEPPSLEEFFGVNESAGGAEQSVEVAGRLVTKGTRVRLSPKRRADAMDMFLEGRAALVEAVHRDVEGATYVAVTVEDDPAADMHSWYGRYFYFAPEEVEPLEDASPPEETRPAGAAPRVLVAGIGNIFNGDDGFGPEVVRRLAERTLPEWANVKDFGIRGLHLAYELLDGGYTTTILVDAAPRGGEPGTVYLIEPDLSGAGRESGPADAHGMHPEAVFQTLTALGGAPGHVLVVGCEPATTDEEIGLSGAVSRGVDEAVELIVELLARPAIAPSHAPQLHSRSR
jgi:hydrogenase maturation protease